MWSSSSTTRLLFTPRRLSSERKPLLGPNKFLCALVGGSSLDSTTRCSWASFSTSSLSARRLWLCVTWSASKQSALHSSSKPSASWLVDDVAERLQDLQLDKALDQRWAKANRELGQLIADKTRHAISYDPIFLATYHEARSKMRDAKQADFITRAAQRINVEGPSGSTATDTINVAVLKNELKEEVVPDMDNPSAQDALDGMLAYYKVENPPQERERLQAKKRMFAEGQAIFKKTTGFER
ncbi:hypothetical protein MBLNU230_g1593t1 [Neophaeotheca triangularis]